MYSIDRHAQNANIPVLGILLLLLLYRKLYAAQKLPLHCFTAPNDWLTVMVAAVAAAMSFFPLRISSKRLTDFGKFHKCANCFSLWWNGCSMEKWTRPFFSISLRLIHSSNHPSTVAILFFFFAARSEWSMLKNQPNNAKKY